jgi:hypothetical protein
MNTHPAIRASALVALGLLVAACGSDESTDGLAPQGEGGALDATAGDAVVGSGNDAASDAASEPAGDDAGDAGKEAASDAGKDATKDAAGDAAATVDAIKALAGTSACYKYQWKDRGQAPKGYVQGVALVFARAVCNPNRSDVLVVSKANTGDDGHDALSWYKSIFSGLSMKNDVAGVDTLRHAYTLLLGLGMRESSGEHCCGRDASATNTSADTAEAGAWQTSYNSHVFSPELPKLFAKYKADSSGCLLATFSAGVTCSADNWKNWGTGDGFEFQKLEKECPAFAAEYAAVMLRVSGGSQGHYGPLRTRAAEVRPECDEMFHQVQTLVGQSPSACGSL